MPLQSKRLPAFFFLVFVSKRKEQISNLLIKILIKSFYDDDEEGKAEQLLKCVITH